MEDWRDGVTSKRSNFLLLSTPVLHYSNTPFRQSVNAKQLAQPAFQVGPNRCKSDHGCQVAQRKLSA